MRRTIKYIMIITGILILLLNGCGMQYGNELFKCSPGNILGVKSVYEKDGEITIICDVNEINNNEISPFFSKIDNPELKRYDRITLYYNKNGEEKYYQVNSEQEASITIVGNDLILTVNTQKVNGEDVYGFGFDSSIINFKDGTIRYTMYGGECMTNYLQNYDENNDVWSELNSEFVLCDETCEP